MSPSSKSCGTASNQPKEDDYSMRALSEVCFSSGVVETELKLAHMRHLTRQYSTLAKSMQVSSKTDGSSV